MRVCPHCKVKYGDELGRCPADGSVLLEEPKSGQVFVQAGEELARLHMVEASQGRYTIIEKIGQGGWGGVYKALQHSTRRTVALKALRKEVAEDPAARRRFHQEAEAISRLRHPNTVTLFDFGETADGMLFMAMEYVEGQTVDQLLGSAGALDALRTTRIARQVAMSLAEAHEQGIIHRDIKPHNVMLTELGGQKDFVKVLDFGVAKLIASDITMTSTGCTFGTPEYMSPEQVQSKDIDHRSDLYSLGIIIYEMLTGAPPFTGGSPLTVALAHAHKKPPPIERDREVPGPLRALVKRLLAKDPAARPSTAMEVAEELEQIETHVLQQGGRVKPVRRRGQTTRVTAWVSSNWTALLTASAVVLLLVAGLTVVKRHFLGSNSDGDDRPETAAAHPAEDGNAKSTGREHAAQEAAIRAESQGSSTRAAAAPTTIPVTVSKADAETVNVRPFDFAQGRPFDFAPFDCAQGRQGRPSAIRRLLAAGKDLLLHPQAGQHGGKTPGTEGMETPGTEGSETPGTEGPQSAQSAPRGSIGHPDSTGKETTGPREAVAKADPPTEMVPASKADGLKGIEPASKEDGLKGAEPASKEDGLK